MKVKCTLCGRIDELPDDSLKAKRLRNRQSYLYLCDDCHERITIKTKVRHKTGKFKLYCEKKEHDEYI